MPIEDRNLSAGTKLVAKYKGETFHAEVVRTEDGLGHLDAGARECERHELIVKHRDADQDPRQARIAHAFHLAPRRHPIATATS